ncbi:hypothetical protein D3C72_1624600 [compost metagenome]
MKWPNSWPMTEATSAALRNAMYGKGRYSTRPEGTMLPLLSRTGCSVTKKPSLRPTTMLSGMPAPVLAATRSTKAHSSGAFSRASAWPITSIGSFSIALRDAFHTSHSTLQPEYSKNSARPPSTSMNFMSPLL